MLRIALLSRVLAAAALLALAGLIARGADAHEMQPSVLEFAVEDGQLRMTVETALEALIAGIDLGEVTDTNQSELSGDYDALRALPPEALEAEARRFFPAFAERLRLHAGETDLMPVLEAVEVPPVGDLEQARLSRLKMTAALPQPPGPLIVGWDASFGPLVVRQIGVEEPYTALLQNGAASEPIDLRGGSALGAWESFVFYIAVGFDHIVPKGLDHILFVLGLFFLSLHLRPLLWQVTSFTVAHTITLALGTLGIVNLPAEIVEPLIALSIVYVGVENVLSRGLSPWRPAVVFLFGLLHGLGFASVLQDFGLSTSQFVSGLIGFNLGVELGQLAVIAAAFLVVGLWFGRKPWYRSRIANPASILIAAVGAWWAFERVFL